MVYVYPDYKTTLVGLFVNDTMISARAGKIVAHRCKDGMMEIDVSKPKKDAPSVSYFKATNIRINDKVILADTMSCLPDVMFQFSAHDFGSF